MNKVRVFLADDHTLVRAGIRALLTSLANVEVVGEASDGESAWKQLQELKPDIAILDISMPAPGGLELARRVAAHLPATRVIILSMHVSEEYVLQAMQANAAGYLVKGADTSELELAIKAVSNGGTYLSPAVSGHVVGYLRRVGSAAASSEATPEKRPDSLTPRQREVLELVALGLTTKEIGDKLGLSVKTVESHRAQLMRELGIHDVTGLVRYAIRTGLIRADK